MSLNTQSFAQWRQLLSIAYNEAATNPALDIPGEPLDAIFNAVALLAMQIQAEIQYEDAISRLATIPLTPEPNPDIDSFCDPFGVPRLEGAAAIVPVVWSLPSAPSVNVTIPAGTIVQTGNGLPQVRFVSSADAVIPSGATSVAGSVTCTVVGTLGNVLAGQISQVVSGPGNGPALPGGLTVTNPDDVINGSSAELNADYVARFTLAIQTGKTGSRSAIAAAILGVQPGLTYTIGDQMDPSGNPRPSSFTVFVAPLGSSPPTQTGLLVEVQQAIEGNPTLGVPQVRSAGIQYNVVSPSGIGVNVAGTVELVENLPAGVTQSSVLAACETAVASYLESIGLDPLGNSTMASLFKVGSVLTNVPYVADVPSLTLNGEEANVVAGYGALVYPGTINITAA